MTESRSQKNQVIKKTSDVLYIYIQNQIMRVFPRPSRNLQNPETRVKINRGRIKEEWRSKRGNREIKIDIL